MVPAWASDGRLRERFGSKLPISRKQQLLATTAIVLTLLCFFGIPFGTKRSGSFDFTQWHDKIVKARPLHGNIPQEVQVLQNLEIPSYFHYRRFCIHVTPERNMSREMLIDVPRLLPTEADTTELNFDENYVPDLTAETLFPDCYSTFPLEVPAFDNRPANSTRPLMLGVATTLERIEASLPSFTRWLSHTGSPLVVLLTDQQTMRPIRAQVERIQSNYSAHGIEAVFETYRGSKKDGGALKNFALADMFNKYRRDDTEWFGIVDDDTFFISLQDVMAVLTDFPSEYPWYIGALTERHSRFSLEGFKAWGGGGFFISPPLMETIVEHYDECRALAKRHGDVLWRDCILAVTSPTVPLTEIPGLNQLDLWRDVSGWYEGPHDFILSLHHWKSWHHFDVPLAHEVADVAGPDAFLQRYQFLNNTVFTNAYSIVEYPNGLPDLNLFELTFTEDVGKTRKPGWLEFHNSLGRTRSPLKKGKDKISWTFQDGIKASDGTVRQFYVNRANGNKNVSIIEVDLRPSAG